MNNQIPFYLQMNWGSGNQWAWSEISTGNSNHAWGISKHHKTDFCDSKD
jgi:hypothetical protein